MRHKPASSGIWKALPEMRLEIEHCCVDATKPFQGVRQVLDVVHKPLLARRSRRRHGLKVQRQLPVQKLKNAAEYFLHLLRRQICRQDLVHGLRVLDRVRDELRCARSASCS